MTASGGRALDAAVTEWGRMVREPTAQRRNGAGAIDQYIRGPLGLGWRSAALKAGDTAAYTRNRQFEWCGAFAAACWGAAGLDAEVRRLRFASTYKLGSTEAMHGLRLLAVKLDALQPGDVLVVGKGGGLDGGHRWGDHVTIVQAVADGLIYTVEGNARGRLGDGSIGEGVVMRTRPFRATSAACPVSGLRQTMHAMFAFRPTAAMLGGAE